MVEETLALVAVAVEFEPEPEPAPAVEELLPLLVPMMLELAVPRGTERLEEVESIEELEELLVKASARRYATLAEARLERERAATAAEMKEGIILVVECCC